MVTYDYYRIFYYVATCHSFTEAARVLHNSQPNILRCINNMEAELQCQLFLRGNHGVTLTPEGERLFIHVSAAFKHLTIGEDELRRNQELKSGFITIGASETALHLILLDALEKFHGKYPGIHTHIYNYSTPQALDALINGMVDFSLVTTPMKIKKPLRKISLLSFQEILLGGAKFQGLCADVHSLSELVDMPFISLHQDTGTRNLYDHYFFSHGLNFHPEMEVATIDQILPMIRHNLGIGFYPKQLATDCLSQNSVYQILLTKPIPQREVCLVLDDIRPMSKASKTLITELHDTISIFPTTSGNS